MLYGSGSVALLDKAPYLNVTAGPNQTVNEGDSVTLNGTFVDPDDTDTQSFDWHVVASNGQMIADGTGPAFTFTPGDAGVYTVTYTVSDPSGGKAAAVVEITADPVAPVLTAPAGSQNAVTGQSELLDLGTLAVKGDGPWTVTVLWGDGRSSIFSPAGSGPLALAHAYSQAGMYTISETVAEFDGDSTSITFANPVVVVDQMLSITSLGAVSPNPRNTPVASIDVTFNEPIDPNTISSLDLSLTHGGPNLINSSVTVSLISGSTYQIGGLAALSASGGSYELTVNASGIEDQHGNAGSGSLSTFWLMDVTPPQSHVSALPARGDSLVFPVAVTGSDPVGPGGSPPSGVASYDILVSTNGGAWTLWTSVPASNPTASFTGQSNTTYAFYSIAHDSAGNVEKKTPLIEASTYVPNLTPPVTSVDGTTGANPSSVIASTGTFTLDLTGNDPGGGVVTYFEVFVSVDGGANQEVGPYAIPAGPADSTGKYHSTAVYQGLTDGRSHTYSFFSVGYDSADNVQSFPSSPNVTFADEVFAQPSGLQVTGFTVEHGSPERSYIRYLDLNLNESDIQSGGELTAMVNSIGGSSPDIQVFKYDLNGDASSKTAVPLSGPTVLAVIDHAIEIDFGAGGLGGDPRSTAADGYYEVDIHLPSGQTAVHHFYRLLGDVDGDGIVDESDLNEIAANIGETSPQGWTPLSCDAADTGTITAVDLTLATRSKGRKLGSGLSLG